MRPGNRFHMVNTDKVSFDGATFIKLYLPVLGKTAFNLYQLLRVSTSGKIASLLEYLNVGENAFETALDKLSALALLDIYDRHTDYAFDLKSPVSYEIFMADDFYCALLMEKIGAANVDKLRRLPVSGKKISKKFSDVFEVMLITENTSVLSQKNPVSADKLDLPMFKAQMKRQDLAFINEATEILQLYSMSEKFGLDWYALFKLAETTANADHTLNTQAMMVQLTTEGRESTRADSSASILSTSKENSFERSESYRQLLAVAKAHAPQQFLIQLKRQVGGFVSTDEKKNLQKLATKLPNEVQNILIHYILVQEGNASLSATFVNRVANDWMRHKVTTAEGALSRISEFNVSKHSSKTRVAPAKTVKPAPKWSNPAYTNKTSAEEQEELTRIKNEALKKLKKEGV